MVKSANSSGSNLAVQQCVGFFQEIRFYVDLSTIKMIIVVMIMVMIIVMIMIMVLMTTGLQRSRVLSRISFAHLSFP